MVLNMNQILVTGFQPFLGQPINPSALIAKKLEQEDPAGFKSLILPVQYQKGFEVLKDELLKSSIFPKKIILLGQAAGREKICLERVALNWIESAHADEAGVASSPREIIPGAPSSYIQKEWSFANTLCMGQVKVSHSAGTYVCNELYFQMLHHFQKNQKDICFVHLPLLPEQVSPQNPQPSLELHKQVQLVLELIQEFAK